MTVKDKNRIPQLVNAMPGIMERTAQRAGQFMHAKLIEKIDRGDPSWAKLSEFTIARKRSTKPWVDTGELRSLITYKIEVEGQTYHVQVGIFSDEKAMIASVLEFGATIMVTPKMRAYLHHIGMHLRRDTASIHIPARPLFRATFDEHVDNLESVIEKFLVAEIRKVLK